jgi:hypothetical protein
MRLCKKAWQEWLRRAGVAGGDPAIARPEYPL